jgi:hypothetical protein
MKTLKFLAIGLCAVHVIFSSCKKDSLSEKEVVYHTDTIILPQAPPRMTSFAFSAAANTIALSGDVECTISNGTITGRIANAAPTMRLAARFTLKGAGARAYINGVEQKSDTSIVDFSSPVEYAVKDTLGQERRYAVSITWFTGLPVIYINTDANAPIESKETYVNASIKIAENSNMLLSDRMKIKGRGNTTWEAPKKPYKMKFDSKISLLGMPKDKEWVLLANYYDKTALRNEAAFYMGRQSENLAWTPRTKFVELFLNEVYMGTYQLCEQIKIAADRVNVTDNGYLMEIDQLSRLDAGDIYFQTQRLLFCIKEPDVEQDGERYNYIKNYVSNVETMLYEENFDAENGYAQYVDIPSFVDWYLVNEITKNNDALMHSSCYIHIAPDGKLRMGPLWDYDISLGNINYNDNELPSGFWVRNAAWWVQLFKDTAFTAAVKERFPFYKHKKNEIFNYVNQNAALLQWSVIENNNKWRIFYDYTWPNFAIWGSYSNEVQYMKNWLDARFAWLEQAFEEL